MSQTARPMAGQRYRHFKGNLYQIVTIGYHTGTDEEMVVYQALYGEYKVYIRPLSEFFDPVDREKYPEVPQETRFELVYSPETEMEVPAGASFAGGASDDQEGGGVNPLLMQFLDAETYSEKLKIFLEMRDTIDEVLLTDVAASLDIATGTGSLEQQYASVQFALHTLAKYERNKR